MAAYCFLSQKVGLDHEDYFIQLKRKIEGDEPGMWNE